MALIEAADRDLTERGITRKGETRSLLELRIRLSGRLERWLRELEARRPAVLRGLTRAEAVSTAVRDEVAQGMRLVDEARQRGDLAGSRRVGPRVSAVPVAHDAALVLAVLIGARERSTLGGASPGVPMAGRRRVPRRALAYAVCVLDASARRLEDHRPGCDPARGDYRAGTAGRPAVRACRRSRAGHPVLDAVAGFVKRTPFLRRGGRDLVLPRDPNRDGRYSRGVGRRCAGSVGSPALLLVVDELAQWVQRPVVAPVRSRAHRHRQGRTDARSS